MIRPENFQRQQAWQIVGPVAAILNKAIKGINEESL